MHKVITVVFLTTTVLFGSLYFTNSGQLKQVEVKNPVNSKLQSEVSALQNQVKLLSQENDKLKNQLTLFENVKATQQKTVKTDPSTGEKKVEIASTPATSSPFLKLLADPKMQEMMKERRNRMVEGRYGYLLSKMNLTEGQRAKLVELLGEGQSAAMAAGMKARMSESDEDRQAANEEREQAQAEIDAKIADLLGDQYAAYTDYKQKEGEYREVSGLNRDLGESKLSDTQTDQLVSVMNQTNSSFQFTNQKINDDPRSVYSLSDEEKAEYVKELEVRDELILKESASFLNEEQLEALKKEQASDRERITRRRGGDRGRFGRGGF